MSVEWVLVALFISGACFGAIVVLAITEHAVDGRKVGIINRLEEMEHAVDAGNIDRIDVPADVLREWFFYVWTGNNE